MSRSGTLRARSRACPCTSFSARNATGSPPTPPTLATYDSVDGFVDEAKETLERGFRAYKIHPGRLGPLDVAAMAGRVRELAGVDFPLMLDPNCGYDFRCALEVGRALDDNRFHWYEDPVRHHDIDAIAELSRRLRTPLSMTDQSEAQLFDSARYIRRQALRIVRGTALRLGITRPQKALLARRELRSPMRDRHRRQRTSERREPARDALGSKLRVL